MFNSFFRLFSLVLILCASDAVCEAQIIQGKPAPPDTAQAEDLDAYPDLPPLTKQQEKHTDAARNAVLNYLGAPKRPTHFSSKFEYYVSSTFSPRIVIEAALIAGVPNLPSAPAQPQVPSFLDAVTGPAYEAAFQTYGDKMNAWRRSSEVELRYRGNRAAVGLATAETRTVLSDLVLPVMLRQVGRYEPADIDARFGSRIGHAFASIAVARTDSGSLVPNYSKLIGTAGAAMVGRFYYANTLSQKELDSNQFIAKYIGYSLAGDLATNVGREVIRTAVRYDIVRADENGPSFQEAYYPLSFGGKVFNWTRSIYGVRNFIAAGLTAGVPSISEQPVYPSTPQIDSLEAELAYDRQLTQYGAAEQLWRDNLEQDIRNHGRRFIGGLSESETQTAFAKLILPVALHMDPRYIPLGSGHNPGARMVNGFAGLAITRMDSGRRVPNIPLLAGNVGAALIASQYYYPQLGVDSLTSGQVMEKTIGFNLAGDLLINLISEFFPRRTF